MVNSLVKWQALQKVGQQASEGRIEGIPWMRVTYDRSVGRNLGEAYVQHIGCLLAQIMIIRLIKVTEM